MPVRARTALSGIVIAVLFCLPLIPEILGSRRLIFRDAHITHWPWRRVAIAALEQGRVPFVNGAASGGEPFLANPNAALLYPTLLLETVFPPASAFNLHYLLHVLWAFFGARLLAKRIGLSEGSAFAAGAAFSFSGILLSYASAFANSSAAAAWMPWCGAAAVAIARARNGPQTLRAAAALGVAVALQLLAGEPAISLLTLVLAAALLFAPRLRAPDAGRARAVGRRAAGGAVAAILAAGLAAALLVPLAQVFPLTYRGQHVFSQRAFGASPFQLWRLLEWLFPRFNGDPGVLGIGAHWQYALHPGDLVYIWRVTLGVIPLAIVALATLSAGFWRRRTILLAAGALTSFLFSLGSRLPLYSLLARSESFRRLRYPIKFYLLTTLCFALLVGCAVEHFRARRAGRREAVLLLLLLAVFAAAFFAAGPGRMLDTRVGPLLEGLAVPAEGLLPEIRSVFRTDALLGAAAVTAVALVLYLRPRAPAVGYLLGFATTALALPWALPLFVSAPERDLERPPALQGELSGGGRLYVSARLPELNVLATGTAHPDMAPRIARLARVQIEELIPATGAPFGVRYAFDADPDGSYGYYNRIVSEAISASAPADRGRLLRAFGTRWIIAEEGEEFPPAQAITGATIAGRRVVLLELPAPVPDVRWAGRAFRRSSLSGAVALLRSETFDAGSEVVLPGERDRDASGPPARARFSHRSEQIAALSVRVEADAPGHLVFSRTYFPSWRATLDGRPVRVLVANGRDLAVAVPGGPHRVEIAWDRTSLRVGVLLQLTAFAAVVVLSALPKSRRRH